MKLQIAVFKICCILVLFGTGMQQLFAQHDWTWTFGDSVVMHFPNGGAPVVSQTERSRSTFEVGACYSDSSGSLVVFANEDSIYGPDFQALDGGRFWSILLSYTQGLLLLPSPKGEDSIYAFSLHYNCGNQVSTCLGAKVIGLDSNGNRFASRTFELGYPGPNGNGFTEKLQAVRHANGRDWWIYVHDIDNSDFYRYLLDANSVSGPFHQAIGSAHAYFSQNAMYPVGEMTFSQDGRKLLVATGTGVLDVFDVDRCTGLLSNWVQVSPPAVRGPNNWYGCSFSPDGTKVYGDELDLPYNSHLYQWDLNAPNIPASKTLIYADTTTDTYWGQHQLGPDGKIYITTFSPD